MDKLRMGKLSAMQAIADIFRQPQAATAVKPSLSRPWNVYAEADLRAKRTPAFPYVYVIDHDAFDLNLRTPVILVLFGSQLTEFQLELGNNNFGKAASMDLHCIGRSRGESEDIASYIAETLRSVPIYDYNNPLTAGVTPALDTRTTPIGSTPPAPYYPILSYLTIDPRITLSPLKISEGKRFQGMLLGAWIARVRYLSAF